MALKSTGEFHGPLPGMLCVGSTSCQPSPLNAGFSLRKRLFIVSIAAQPVQSDGEIMTALTPAWLRIRSKPAGDRSRAATHAPPPPPTHGRPAPRCAAARGGDNGKRLSRGERALHDVGLRVLKD